MATFPTREAEVAALAGTMLHGLGEYAEDFPESPVSVEALHEALLRFTTTSDAAASADGAAAEAHEQKREAIADLTDKRISNADTSLPDRYRGSHKHTLGCCRS